jgi:DNA-directed RNA polymerase specialized sigma24 family protein
VDPTNRQPDRDLVLSAGEGREEAFDALRDRYYLSVLGFLTALVGDAAAADAADVTFATAHEALQSLEHPDRFKSWLFAHAHRTGLEVRTSRERRGSIRRMLRHRTRGSAATVATSSYTRSTT